MANRGHIEAGGNNLAIAPGDHLADFLGSLIDEQNEEDRLRMVDRHPLDDRLEEHRLAGPSGRHDECALAVAYGRNEIDRPASQLRSPFGGPAGLELELALGIRRDERSEIWSPCRFLRTGAIYLLDVHNDDPIAMIVSRGREHLIATAQHVLPHDVRRHVRVARLGEITVCGAADEAPLALWIEPPRSLSIGDDGSYRSARALFTTRRIRLLLLPLSSAPPLIAAAASVVAVVALSGMTLRIAFALLAATHCLWIVLLLWGAGIARSICWRSSGRIARICFGARRG